MAPPRSNKKTEGRKKIDMKLIENESARTVTFSKRRSGIFKKATELSILCGARVAVLIFSLCGRAYTFGHPSVESVLSRFLNRAPPPSLQDSAEGRRIHAATIQQLKDQCEESREKLEKKRARRKELESALDRSPYHATEEKLSKMSVDQLKELKAKMESLREKLKARSVGEANVSAGEAAVTEVQKNTAVDLANVEGDGHGASTIPSDWLKL